MRLHLLAPLARRPPRSMRLGRPQVPLPQPPRHPQRLRSMRLEDRAPRLRSTRSGRQVLRRPRLRLARLHRPSWTRSEPSRVRILAAVASTSSERQAAPALLQLLRPSTRSTRSTRERQAASAITSLPSRRQLRPTRSRRLTHSSRSAPPLPPPLRQAFRRHEGRAVICSPAAVRTLGSARSRRLRPRVATRLRLRAAMQWGREASRAASRGWEALRQWRTLSMLSARDLRQCSKRSTRLEAAPLQGTITCTCSSPKRRCITSSSTRTNSSSSNSGMAKPPPSKATSSKMPLSKVTHRSTRHSSSRCTQRLSRCTPLRRQARGRTARASSRYTCPRADMAFVRVAHSPLSVQAAAPSAAAINDPFASLSISSTLGSAGASTASRGNSFERPAASTHAMTGATGSFGNPMPSAAPGSRGQSFQSNAMPAVGMGGGPSPVSSFSYPQQPSAAQAQPSYVDS